MGKAGKKITPSLINQKGRFSFVIPVYNHAGSVAQVIRRAKKLGFPVFVVNDGSTDNTYAEIRNIHGIRTICHAKNMGKGAALMSGFAAAASEADWAITIGRRRPAPPGRRIKFNCRNSRVETRNCSRGQRRHARRTCPLDKPLRPEIFQFLGLGVGRSSSFRFSERHAHIPFTGDNRPACQSAALSIRSRNSRTGKKKGAACIGGAGQG